MLAIEVADRPSAQDVNATVSFIALKSLALKVDKNYTLASTNTHKSFNCGVYRSEKIPRLASGFRNE